MRTVGVVILLVIAAFYACDDAGVDCGDAPAADSLITAIEKSDTLYELTRQQADSLEFRLLHHYTNNFNFVVKADSLVLVPGEDRMTDTCVVRRHDVIAVADIRVDETGDTVWVKVARDQFTMGWTGEDALLKSTVPDDLISQMIDTLTGSRSAWMSAIVVLGLVCYLFRRGTRHTLQIFRFEEMDSFYPVFLLILVSVTACLYVSIQNFAPEFWQEYYFHPTLNPLILPPVMAALVTLVWLTLTVFVAMVIEVYHHFYIVQGMYYIFELLGVSMISYLVVSWTTALYVGYPLTVAYIVLLLWIYFRHIRCWYVCGHCGQRMRIKGKCPHCGRVNE